MIFVSTIGFSGMPDLVVWSQINLDIALWAKSKMAAICPRSSIKLIYFSTKFEQLHDCNLYYRVFRYADLVMWPENILDIALWVENPRWPPYGQGQTLN